MNRYQTQPDAGALGLGDTISIILGIIIGVGIFKTPALIFQNVSGVWEALAVWAFGGFLSLLGALCFAELAATYPRSGGEYVYLTRAYGRPVGFLFAWAQLSVIRTGGGIAALAYVFADAASTLVDVGRGTTILCAGGAIVVLSIINMLGVIPGKRTQNLLTTAKLLGLAGIVLVGFFWSGTSPALPTRSVDGVGSFALAMIFVLYTYDGWNEAVYVAAEVHRPRRNLPLALVAGTAAVAVIYLLVNGACLVGLGLERARSSPVPVAEVLALAWGETGTRAINVLVMISALGGINGMIFTGSRVYCEWGAEHRLFSPLGRWSERWQTPVWPLVIQAVISIAMVAAVGLWWHGQDGFDAVVKCTAPVFWGFFLLTGLSLFVLRFKDHSLPRPFLVPGYPLTPVLFCGWCGYMLYGSLVYASDEAIVGLAILLAGVPLYLISRGLHVAKDEVLAVPPFVEAVWDKERQRVA